MKIYESLKRYEVFAENVEEFCNTYHRRGAYHDRGQEYMDYDLQDHIKEFEKYGYTIIPQGSSTTGDICTYYGRKSKDDNI